MRFQVVFQYNATTGEVEIFQVDTVAETGRARDHDALHDQVGAELARLVEVDAEVVEQPQAIPSAPTGFRGADPGETAPQVSPRTHEESGG